MAKVREGRFLSADFGVGDISPFTLKCALLMAKGLLKGVFYALP